MVALVSSPLPFTFAAPKEGSYQLRLGRPSDAPGIEPSLPNCESGVLTTAIDGTEMVFCRQGCTTGCVKYALLSKSGEGKCENCCKLQSRFDALLQFKRLVILFVVDEPVESCAPTFTLWQKERFGGNIWKKVRDRAKQIGSKMLRTPFPIDRYRYDQ